MLASVAGRLPQRALPRTVTLSAKRRLLTGLLRPRADGAVQDCERRQRGRLGGGVEMPLRNAACVHDGASSRHAFMRTGVAAKLLVLPTHRPVESATLPAR